MDIRRLVLFPAIGMLTMGFALAAAACGDDDGDGGEATILAATATPGARSEGSVTTSATPATRAASPAITGSPTRSASPGGSASPSGTAGAAEIKTANTAKGMALTDGAGLTLYTFDNDTTVGKSSCNGNCATTWPPLTTTATNAPSNVAGATGTFTIITRDDGTKQIAYKDKPLYRYAADRAPGDVNGDGVGGVWRIATP